MPSLAVNYHSSNKPVSTLNSMPSYNKMSTKEEKEEQLKAAQEAKLPDSKSMTAAEGKDKAEAQLGLEKMVKDNEASAREGNAEEKQEEVPSAKIVDS